MHTHIRPFVERDADRLVDILTRNGQFGHPDVEGTAAMRRVASCDAAVFLVAEVDGQPEGLVRAVYDGSRALIHLLSVNPSAQGRGIGRSLVSAVQVAAGVLFARLSDAQARDLKETARRSSSSGS